MDCARAASNVVGTQNDIENRRNENFPFALLSIKCGLRNRNLAQFFYSCAIQICLEIEIAFLGKCAGIAIIVNLWLAGWRNMRKIIES